MFARTQNVDLSRIDPAATHGCARETASAELEAGLARLTDLQDRLWAEGKRRVLVVLQARRVRNRLRPSRAAAQLWAACGYEPRTLSIVVTAPRSARAARVAGRARSASRSTQKTYSQARSRLGRDSSVLMLRS